MNIDEQLQNFLQQREKTGLKRRLRLAKGLVDFCSNDYLGISWNEEIHQNIIKSLQMGDFKIGSGGSRLLAGNAPLHEQLEETLKKVHQAEAALLFNSGYAANMGFFATVPQKGDTVLYDELIHACVKDGMRLSFADKYSFKHNDVEHLENRLQKAKGNVFVAVESVYSMDGDFAPLVKLVELCEKHKANLVVDEAHSTGSFGEKGAGLCVELGIEDRVYARIHTFGKAIGAHGACVVGSEILKQYLINFSRQFIYTTSLPEHHLLVLKEIYSYLSENYATLQQQLQQKIKLFKTEIKAERVESDSSIQAILISGNEKVTAVAEKMNDAGFDVRSVKSPTVAKGKERLRVCLHTFNSDEEIIGLCQKINEYLSI